MQRLSSPPGARGWVVVAALVWVRLAIGASCPSSSMREEVQRAVTSALASAPVFWTRDLQLAVAEKFAEGECEVLNEKRLSETQLRSNRARAVQRYIQEVMKGAKIPLAAAVVLEEAGDRGGLFYTPTNPWPRMMLETDQALTAMAINGEPARLDARQFNLRSGDNQIVLEAGALECRLPLQAAPGKRYRCAWLSASPDPDRRCGCHEDEER